MDIHLVSFSVCLFIFSSYLHYSIADCCCSCVVCLTENQTTKNPVRFWFSCLFAKFPMVLLTNGCAHAILQAFPTITGLQMIAIQSQTVYVQIGATQIKMKYS